MSRKHFISGQKCCEIFPYMFSQLSKLLGLDGTVLDGKKISVWIPVPTVPRNQRNSG